jgi:ADP-ribose pyrophosphatase YjhB (NUDIX family)
MSHEASIHEAQTLILRELLFVPSANFSGLQKVTKLESDHAKFHVKRLVELGYLAKNGLEYTLTVKGKEYANKLDTDAGVIERQPKIAVMLIVERSRGGNDKYVVQQRCKQPFYGYWGPPTGKVRWGETIIETASRELLEETGLSAQFVHQGIHHEIVRLRQPDGTVSEPVEDKVFHLMLCREPKGQMLEQFEGGRNSWRTLASMRDEEKKYQSFDQEMQLGIDGVPFTETTHIYDSDTF